MLGRRSIWIVVGAVAAVLAVFLARGLAPRVPAPGSERYEQVTRVFYHGLAALEVGLLDDARTQFGRAIELAPGEPAAWANLALTHLRLGELDAAAGPMERALALAPRNAEIALLAGRMETTRGRLDEGIARLRRAVELDARSVRARMALAEEIERAGGPDADAEALRLLDEVAERMPSNIAVLLERARLSAKAGDAARLREAVERLAEYAAGWPPIAQQQYAALRMAVEGGAVADAVRATVLLRNVLTRVPAFLEGLTAVRTPPEIVADPFVRFLAMQPVSTTPSPRDGSLGFTAEALSGADDSVVEAATAAWLTTDGPPVVLAVDRAGVRALDDSGRRWPSEGAAPNPSRSADTGALVLDWNRDFRPDVVTVESDRLRLWLQTDGGQFPPATPGQAGPGVFACACTGAWAADIEMDGDLDVVAGIARQAPVVLRNNGDGTWREIRPFAGAEGARAFAWADIDQDADPDAVFLDASGRVSLFLNRQAGQFTPVEPPPGTAAPIALAVADVDADGVFDVVLLDRSGSISRYSYGNAAWSTEAIGAWPAMGGAEVGRYRLVIADLDNNGGVDVVASGNGAARIWLSDETRAWHEWPGALEGEVFSAADLDGDGRLELVGTSRGRPTRFSNRASAGYHWKLVRARAQQTAGDQRVNSFGVGGTVEVRAGLLLQRHVLTGAPVHVGLGTHTAIDVARIVWPNGVPQAEFGAGVDDTIVAEQRLKGSCPWVFAWDGRRVGFVTDFLWRSPLGLRINAQDTAGVAQTEDWVRLRGDQLVPRDGAYDVRITAELWETHFFDHVSLLVVDHPADVEMFVDERFAPASPPALEVRAFASRQAVASARDEHERDVTTLVAAADGRTVASFDLGPYQGIAREHWLELELATPVPGQGFPTLLATGWIYPTDSSINVAVGQGSSEPPRGIALEVDDGRGGWTTVQADIGFPAGKNKTMLIDLRPAAGATRLRLRTNLEVYWDALAVATRVEAPLRVTRLAASSAELRYRGFSRTTSPRGDSPETPEYDRLAGVAQRWRDLEGYHTRFGDVRELVAGVDDRYVIMNAGDELRLRFPEQPAPDALPGGWRRDYVLIGDGWEKDGDYNTEFSQTVLPLPSHANPGYRRTGNGTLDEDPVYLQHRADWEQYHTRYVTPRSFVTGLFRH